MLRAGDGGGGNRASTGSGVCACGDELGVADGGAGDGERGADDGREMGEREGRGARTPVI